MEIGKDGAEAIVVRVWSGMGMQLGVPEGLTQLHDLKGMETLELGEAMLHDQKLIRKMLAPVDRADLNVSYESLRPQLRHPAYRNAPLQMVREALGLPPEVPDRIATYQELGTPRFFGSCMVQDGERVSACTVPEDLFNAWKARGFEGAVVLEWRGSLKHGAFCAVGLAEGQG